MEKVLVVDDDEILRSSVQESLKLHHLRLKPYDGVDAVKKVKSQHFDLVVMDVNMPRMNGLRHSKKLKNLIQVLSLLS